MIERNYSSPKNFKSSSSPEPDVKTNKSSLICNDNSVYKEKSIDDMGNKYDLVSCSNVTNISKGSNNSTSRPIPINGTH